jgi:hypothetical protein
MRRRHAAILAVALTIALVFGTAVPRVGPDR